MRGPSVEAPAPTARACGPAVEAQAAAVFERRPPSLVRAGLLAALASALGAALLNERAGDLAAAVADGLPYASAPLARAVVVRAGCALSPLVVLLGVVLWFPRRYGRVEVGPDLVTFHPALRLSRHPFANVLPRAAITERRLLSCGLELRGATLGAVAAREAHVVPVRDEAEAARVHALLDAPLRPALEAGEQVPLGRLLLTLTPFMLGTSATLETGARLGAGLGLLAAAALGLALLGALRLAGGRWGRLHASRSALGLPGAALPWRSVASAALADERLAVETVDGRRLQVRVGRGAHLGPLRALLEERLAAAGRRLEPRLPPWASRWRRRLDLAVTLLLLLLAFAPLGATTLAGQG